jgi:DNA-binding transcriptional LysR family regulator
MGVFAAKNAFHDRPQTEVPFVVPIQPIRGAASRIQGLDGWPDDAYVRKVAFEVTLMQSAIQLTEQGLAAVYLPEFIVELHNQRVRKELELVRLPSPYGTRRCTTDVYIARRKGDLEDRTLRELVRSLRTLTSPTPKHRPILGRKNPK